MKTNLTLFSTILLSNLILSFTSKNEIGQCYISFNTSTNLTAAPPDRLPENSEKIRKLTTDNGEVEVGSILLRGDILTQKNQLTINSRKLVEQQLELEGNDRMVTEEV